MISRLSTWWNELTTDPLNFLVSAVIFAVALLFSLIMHENAHGFVAWKCGDPTAKMFGRITMDPRKHLDPVGALCMLFLGIGWARPVPVNPNNFRKRGRDTILVSVAGIGMNLVIFIISTFLYVLMFTVPSFAVKGYIYKLLIYLMSFNISLAVFNLLPIPPLDGYRLVNQLLFKGELSVSDRAMMIIRYGFLLICLTGVLGNAFSKVCNACINGMISLFAGILL